jgi:hypothetical protein
MECATDGTGPFPLSEIERSQDIPTRRTRLRRWIPPVNLYQRASVPLRLVFQLPHQLAPAHIADGLGEGMVSEHVFHRQGLDAHRLVLTDDAGREFVLKITETGPGSPASLDRGRMARSLQVTIAIASMNQGTEAMANPLYPTVFRSDIK